jgi:23S rRNA pseudouridine2604 synthase
MPGEGEWLAKRMAHDGLCSRREAVAFIRQGLVRVDGAAARDPAVKVLPSQEVRLAPKAAAAQGSWVTILLNKPVGFVSGTPEPGRNPAAALITAENQERRRGDPPFGPRHLAGLAPAGRLDIDSRGLIVFTQDGRIARLLVGEGHAVEKEYLVRVKGDCGESVLASLRHGLSLDGQRLLPARVERINDGQLRFVLREGRKRQIRRMCELVGLEVTGLKRVRIGKVVLGGLPEGRWRFLRRGESF